MKFLRINFHGDPNIGLHGFATDKKCFLGIRLTPSKIKKVEDVLGLKIRPLPLAGTEFTGLFAAGNNNGLLVTKLVEEEELKNLKGLNYKILKSKNTALGNLIVCNDKGCLISPKLRKYKKEIQDTLGCEVLVGMVADLEIVGSVARATNNGCLCHRDATEEEIKVLKDLLKVKVDVGTVNYGTPYVKAGLLVNKNGMVTSESTTGPELDRCFEVFE